MGTTIGEHAATKETIDRLERELPALEAKKRSLETELAAVSEKVEHVRAVLSGLQALSTTAWETAPEQDAEPAAAAGESPQAVATPVEAEAEVAAGVAPVVEAVVEDEPKRRARPKVDLLGARRKAGRTRAKAEGRGPAAVPQQAAEPRTTSRSVPAARTRKAQAAAAPPAVPAQAPSLPEVVSNVLAAAGGPMRANDVIRTAGLDENERTVANVRAALGRLAGQGRARRIARGVFETVPQN